MEYVVVFLDDIIFAKDKQEYDKSRRLVLDKIRSEKIKLNKTKGQIGVHQIQFVGHCIN